ncbi:MAG: peroxiredoxin [Armatimonadota bacterium]
MKPLRSYRSRLALFSFIALSAAASFMAGTADAGPVTGEGSSPRTRATARPKAEVYLFTAVHCPAANMAAPEVARRARADAARGVRWNLVYSNPGDIPEAKAHATRMGLGKIDRRLDSDQALARRLGARSTPQVIVVDATGVVVFRGAPDPAGRPGPAGAAIDAVLSGRRPIVTHTPVVGCALERPISKVRPGTPTYASRVAGLLDRHCVSCHRAGEIGPMALDSYSAARRFATNIASVVGSGTMPPWKPVEGHGDHLDVRRLPQTDRDDLVRWAEGGAPAGDLSRAPAPRSRPAGWALGKPDLVLEMPRAWKVPASGPDDYRCFVLPTGLTTDREVVAVEYRAGNNRVVHHVLGFVDTAGEGRRRDAADPGPGYTSFGGPGFLPTGEVGGWAPGNFPRFLPEGVARPLPAGSDIIIQVHYHPSGVPETDVTKVGLYFAKRPVKRHLRILPLLAKVDVPPGDPAWKTRQSYALPMDVDALFVVPHMHLIGKAIRVDAKLPDGRGEPLVRIDDWDFNWQDTYVFRNPVKLPRGSVLTLAATYDNSSSNPRQPVSEPRRVGWGEATTDEMCVAFVGYVVENEDDPAVRALDLLFGGGAARRASSQGAR